MSDYSDTTKWRPRYGTCPGCGQPEGLWCTSDCPLVDPMDYR